MIDYLVLKNELQNDPLKLGYITSDDVANAIILNSTKGTGSAVITLSTLSRLTFLEVLLQVGLTFSSLSTALQAKWNVVMNIALQLPDGAEESNNIIQQVIQAAITDGVMTQTQVNSFIQRMGSRAEVLFGQNTFITASDVSKSLRGG